MRKSVSLALVISLLVSMVIFITPQPVYAVTYGSVNMSGDAAINCDSFADSSATQYRWMSYPGSRLTINANKNGDCKDPADPMNNKLALDVGGWWGNAVKNFDEIIRTQMASTGGTANDASSFSTTWYPYKIAFNAAYGTPSGTSVSGYDTMINDNSSMLRVVNVSAPSGNDVVMTGKITGSGGGQWIGGNDKVVLVSDSSYYYAIHFVTLNGAELTPVELGEVATFSGGYWTFRKHFDGSAIIAAGIGYATSAEGSATAISRAKGVFSQNVSVTIANQKTYFDNLLKGVPAPSSWGITGIDARGVTSDQHKAMYYSAWTFVLQSLVKALPENSGTYPYPQVMCGKPSLWNVGNPVNPGTSQWESLFGYQMLSFEMPDIAWQSFLGLLSTVDQSGMIGGESLPTRVAQTGWILYQNMPNQTYLSNAYADIKQHLLWAADNPRWIYGDFNIPEMKDLEFVSSYMLDVEFAIKIANALNLPADVTMWQNEKAALLANLQNWFFKDSDLIYGAFFDYTTIPKVWDIGNDMFRATGLAINGLSASQRDKLNSYFMSIHKPANPVDNFPYHKYPDLTCILEGLIENGGHVQARDMAKACLRDTIRAKEMTEAIIATGNGTPTGGVKTESVVPSLFSAVEAIHLTWLLNGFRFDHDTFTSFSFGTSSLPVPNSPDTMPVIEDFKDIGAWSNTYNSYLSALGGAGVFRYFPIVNDTYGVVEKEVAYNVDTSPVLTIKVDKILSANAQWALKVNDGSGDVVLQGDSSQTGEFTYDLKGKTGWSGQKTFKIRVYVIGGDVKISRLSADTTLEDFQSVSDWTAPYQATISAASSIGTITTTGGYGYARKSVSYNVDNNRYLKVKVTELGSGSQWSLKVNDGGTDIALQADISATGELVYDLKAITGWSGQKTFDIKVFAIGGNGKYVKMDYIVLPSR